MFLYFCAPPAVHLTAKLVFSVQSHRTRAYGFFFYLRQQVRIIMNKHTISESIDPADELNYTPRIKNMREKSPKQGQKSNRPHSPQMIEAAYDQDFDIASFTYKASRYEQGWLVESLSSFHELNWFTDMIRLIKGGKEASVYLCSNPAQSQHPLIAAKVYRPRKFRALRNDHAYQEGRARLDASGNVITNHGLNHAMNKRTEFGVELLHISWIEHEYKTMQTLLAAGCDVPEVYAKNSNAILMSYVGDEEMGAPTLNDIELPRKKAAGVFDQVLHNIDLMLTHHRIHADLSAFNILYWDGEITLIDFPQAIHPDENPAAYKIFRRDVQRICEYFARSGIKSDANEIATALWKKHGHFISPRIHPADLNPDDEADRKYWASQNS